MNKRGLWLAVAAQAALVCALALCALLCPKSSVSLAASDLSAEAGETRGGARYIDDGFSYQGYFASTPRLTLPRGSYTVTVDLSCSADKLNVLEIDGGSAEVVSDGKLLLPVTDGEFTTHIWVLDESPVTIKLYYQYGALSVRGISVSDNGAFKWCALLFLACGFAASDALYLHLRALGSRVERRKSIAALVGVVIIAVAASAPLFYSGLRAGFDTSYHLMRIEGYLEGLLEGQLPVRVHPLMLSGYGYGCALLQPDGLLTPAAALRAVGLPIITAYKIFVFLINLATSAAAYLSFRDVFRSREIAMTGCALYTLALYRIVIYDLDGSLGQALAFIFIPLVFASLWRILLGPPDGAGLRRGWLLGVIGCTGIFQSHVQTCEITALIAAMMCLVCVKRLREKGRLGALLKLAGFSLWLNIWFIVPMLDFMRGDYKAFSGGSDALAGSAGDFGLFVSQLFDFTVAGRGGVYGVESGPEGEIPYSVGLALLLGAAIFIASLFKRKERKNLWRVSGAWALVIASAAMFMATRYFPWNGLESLGGIFKTFAASIQFPSKFVGAAALPLSAAACCALKLSGSRARRTLIAAVLAAACAVQLGIYMRGYSTGGWAVYDTAALDSAEIGLGDFLPTGCDVSGLSAAGPTSTRAEIAGYRKDGLYLKMTLNNASQSDEFVELPLLDYPGYSARGDGGEELELSRGENGVLRVSVPSGYAGAVEVSYAGEPLWRAAEAVSLAGAAVYIYLAAKTKRKQGGAAVG